jgi:hypothetical protein
LVKQGGKVVQEKFHETCAGCPHIDDHEDRIDQLVAFETQAKEKGALVSEGSISCRGILRFTRNSIDRMAACKITPRMPVVSDEELMQQIASVWPTEPLPIVRE